MTRSYLYARICLLCIFPFSLAGAAQTTLLQEKVKHIDSKISQLKQALATAHTQHTQVQDSLSTTDQKIDAVTQQLHHTIQVTAAKKQRVEDLTQKVLTLSEALTTQQNALAKFIRLRYLMGEHQALKMILDADHPTDLNHRLMFFRYVIRSHQHLIDRLRQTQTALIQNQRLLKQAYKRYTDLQAELSAQQEALQQQKQIQLHTAEQLTAHIKTDQQTLEEYEHNKIRLSILIANLVGQTPSTPPKKFDARTRPHFSAPLIHPASTMIPWSQGLFFLAPEDTAVQAVQAGRVVFSDWLRGYGLLLILDHGHGLMTLYGYNHSIFKRRGEWVQKGQQIAAIGHSGGRKDSGLYFEVRRYGKVIAARSFLKTTA